MMKYIIYVGCFYSLESIVRTELAEQMPHMAMCAQERTQFSELVPAHLLPIVVKYLTDCNNQVWSYHVKCTFLLSY